jgi:uncharacterized membrane protein
MFWDGAHSFAWQIVLMEVGMLAFFGVVIWLGVVALKTAGGNTPLTKSPEGTKEILDRRLARGEIDVHAYDDLRAEMDHEQKVETVSGSQR